RVREADRGRGTRMGSGPRARLADRLALVRVDRNDHHPFRRDSLLADARRTRSGARHFHMTFIVIGIDGGGSKTHAMVADESGRLLGETVGPGSAVRPGQAEHSANVIADVVRDALASCEMTHVTPRALCVGVAGAGRETERQALWQALVARDLASELVIHSD